MYKKPSVARGLKQSYEKLLNANLRDKVPAWLEAMRMTPASTTIVRDPTYFSTQGKLKFENKAHDTEKNAINGKIKRSLPAGCVSLRHNKKSLKTKSPKPPKIVFPEDSLRREFYKNHPFERLRPRILAELSGKPNMDWSKLTSGSSQVSGESVIRYQYYLMEVEGLSKGEAYSKATKEFYKVRAREDLENKMASQEAYFYGAVGLERPFSAFQLGMEEAYIHRSKDAMDARSNEMSLQNVPSERSFADDSS